ncbi:hypothetical protein [uncultured Brevundimonas sp.]|uniref:hypothetical protein n=1 Tax=uncultured Brevundimonas sp. TaxID=213418 RepID=UPI0025DAD6C9|nr:hypothetical protein [uncultured Brevundimonas sp.]
MGFSLRRFPIEGRNVFSQGISLLMNLDKTTWSPEIFSYDVKCVDLARSGQPFDITGKPRFLISGPYVTMPTGFWKAKIMLGFDDGASRSRFRIDWGEVESYQSQEFYPGRPGHFEIVMSHQWFDAAPAEVRLVQLEGVFDGHVTFGGVEITAGDTRVISDET